MAGGINDAEKAGIRFVTLAEEPGEASERKLYELYKVTHPDIPGYLGDFPWFEEWKKWSIGHAGMRPEWMHIAKDGDRYIGVVYRDLLGFRAEPGNYKMVRELR